MNYTAIAEYSQIASAALFFVTMVWIWIKFIQPAVLTAQSNANAQIALAERHRDEARAVLDSLQGEIEAARRDAGAIRDRCVTQARAEHDAVLKEAREAGERALRNAQGELERARGAAQERFRDELLDQALQLARVQAAQRVDDPMNARLVSSFLASLSRRQTSAQAVPPHG
jgi:F0F1-type ATP synthase membrane subunit b/b'